MKIHFGGENETIHYRTVGKEFYTSHSGLALVGLGINRYSKLPSASKKAFPVTKGTNGIGLDDILRSYLGMLSLGQTDYEAVTNKKNDDYFKHALGIKRVPSAETLRQRLMKCRKSFSPWLIKVRLNS
jgi:hypothetical protein